ncbi:hypothetical protein JJE66_31155, partial [Bradyrhizobium diazoefficiens]|nr:hypothetical protein [Bradyrhizobium diazoefficiens]
LKSYEAIFHQDLNGDGVVSPSSTSPVGSSAGNTLAALHDSSANGSALAELLAHDFLIR